MTGIVEDPAIAEELLRKKKRRRLIITIVLVSLGVHLAAGLVAGAIIVARYFRPPPAVFVAKKVVNMPAQEREHKMNMAAFDGLAPKPSFNDKLQSTRPTAFALPDLPKIPLDQMMPLDPSAIVSSQVTSLAGAGGLGSGTGNGAGGMGGTGTGFSFLGVHVQAKRIMLMYDVSKTVAGAATRAGMPMTRIRDETAKMLDGLGVNTRFAMCEFSRSYAFFRAEMLPATDPNRAAAKEWLTQWFATEGMLPRGVPNTVTGSPGFLVALESAFKLQPDVIFIISDGDCQRGTGFGPETQITPEEIEQTLDRLQKTLPQPAKIQFIGVGMKPEIEKGIKRAILRAGGGGRVSNLKP